MLACVGGERGCADSRFAVRLLYDIVSEECLERSATLRSSFEFTVNNLSSQLLNPMLHTNPNAQLPESKRSVAAIVLVFPLLLTLQEIRRPCRKAAALLERRSLTNTNVIVCASMFTGTSCSWIGTG